MKCNACWRELDGRAVATACGHIFCTEDATKILACDSTCSLCNQILSESSMKSLPNEEWTNMVMAGVPPHCCTMDWEAITISDVSIERMIVELARRHARGKSLEGRALAIAKSFYESSSKFLKPEDLITLHDKVSDPKGGFRTDRCCTLNVEASYASNQEVIACEYLRHDQINTEVLKTLTTINLLLAEDTSSLTSTEKLLRDFKVASVMMARLLKIHPFSDGNGRTVEILVAVTMFESLGFFMAFRTPKGSYERSVLLTCMQESQAEPSRTGPFKSSNVNDPTKLCGFLIHMGWYDLNMDATRKALEMVLEVQELQSNQEHVKAIELLNKAMELHLSVGLHLLHFYR